MSTTPLRDLPAWKSLEAHYSQVRGRHLRELFADDPARGERLTAEAVGLFLDYSKHRVTDETLKLLVQLAEQSDLRGRIDAMFRGDPINVTEHRSVLHVALRAPKGQSIMVDGKDVVPDVHAVLDKDGRVLREDPGRRVERLHRETHPHRHQHRHRRLGPRTGEAGGLPPRPPRSTTAIAA